MSNSNDAPLTMKQYLDFAKQVCELTDTDKVESIVEHIRTVREEGGRLFIIGVGGSAGNASHAVNDFRKLCEVDAYAPTDNVSELTARTNDEGWETVFSGWLKVSNLNQKDAILVFSVGGGDLEKNISPNIVQAVKLAKTVGAKVLGIVGKSTGYTASVGDAVVVVPCVNSSLITPLSEAFQSVIWHGIVSHPRLQRKSTKWEAAVNP